MKNNIWLLIVCSILIVSSIVGCSCAEEREAHQIMGNDYIPKLKDYIQKDPIMDKDLKPIYIMALDRWLDLINKKE